MPTLDVLPPLGTKGLGRRPALAALVLGPWLTANAGAKEGGAALSSHVPGQLQLAQSWPASRSPQGFWVSEKFDGVRAVWDGQVLRFRSGRAISAPAWFVAALPHVPLDGELWIARGAFDRLSGVVRQAVPDDAAWRAVKYCVFDVLGHDGSFDERLRVLQAAVAAASVTWVGPVAHQTVKDAQALQALLHETVRQGGEGLMLHRADALWASGRGDALYKFKPELDEEGVVGGPPSGQGALERANRGLVVAHAFGSNVCPGCWPE